MSCGLTMDYSLLPRSVWTADSKILQHPAELSTGVAVTRSIPAGTCFGPCVTQNNFYETIAFIAQKCSDTMAKPYMFKIDPDAMRNCALVLSWLRLAQAARNEEEQNTEAFLKAGQLLVRTTRDIRPDEELLVWYDQELCHLLGLTDAGKGPHGEFRCGRCKQVFKNKYPFVAHCRFVCAHARSYAWSRDVYAQKHVETKKQHRVTDFHNIARDLEQKISASSDEADLPARKRKPGEDESCSKWRKTVLLEKTNISNEDNVSQAAAGGTTSSPPSDGKTPADQPKAVREGSDGPAAPNGSFPHGAELSARSSLLSSSHSAFSLVLANSQNEQKSAFCRPSRRSSPAEPQPRLSGALAAPSSRPEEVTNRTVLGYSSLMTGRVLGSDLPTLTAPVPLGNAFHYAPEHWSRSFGAQMQTTSSLSVLPSTFTSFGVSVQNWCAKCNLSFRMTSDLVFHMRSHHKKEFAAESQVRRRREEKLTCPICHEYFRERHHLSRHMTSHN